jgi:2-polyprenyl-3-methyl-5-hydroxy-6-metoxy-1,4-benzoquinol methylase
MTTIAAQQIAPEVKVRAERSLGTSESAIYQMAAASLLGVETGGVLVDIGCGQGQLWSYVSTGFERYIGIDAQLYQGFPNNGSFYPADLDVGTSLPDECADVVASLETIEHLENPRAFMRELVRLTKPGGLVVVTTPNQLSLLSLFTLVVKKRFSAFQDVHYPAHLTALLEVDLKRIAAELRLAEIRFSYSLHGRIVLTPWHYPRFLARILPRAFSDNVLLCARKLG